MHRIKTVMAAVVVLALGVGLPGAASANHRPVGYGEAFAALEASTQLDLSSLEADARVEIVPMSTLEPTNGANAEAFAKMRANHAAALEDVREQISNSSRITSALEVQGYTVKNVVAVWNDADKEVTVFVDR